jgi:hypothetical protein
MKHYTIGITVNGTTQYEVHTGENPADAREAARMAMLMAYGSGGVWHVGTATESTPAEIEMSRRLTDTMRRYYH